MKLVLVALLSVLVAMVPAASVAAKPNIDARIRALETKARILNGNDDIEERLD